MAELSLLFDVFALSQRVRGLLDTAMAGCGLRPDEYAAYSVVFESGPVTMTELARQLGLPVTTAADYVRAMRAREHVRRDPHPRDSRAYLLVLTAAGRQAHRRASNAFDKAHRALLAQLPGAEHDYRQALGELIGAVARVTAARPAASTSAGRSRRAAGPVPATRRA